MFTHFYPSIVILQKKFPFYLCCTFYFTTCYTNIIFFFSFHVFEFAKQEGKREKKSVNLQRQKYQYLSLLFFLISKKLDGKHILR